MYMRSYGQRGKGKNDHCGWGCCFHSQQGTVIFARKACKRRQMKRLFKRRARRNAKNDIQHRLKDYYDEPEDQSSP